MSRYLTTGSPLDPKQMTAGKATNEVVEELISRLLRVTPRAMCSISIHTTYNGQPTSYSFFRQANQDTWNSCMEPTGRELMQQYY